MEKQELREHVWEAMRASGMGRFPGIEGRIPNFVGAEAAASRLADTAEWRSASILKANPDSPQFPVRKRALEEGKVVYMAVPRLADAKPFWRLDPEEITVKPHQAASIKGAARHGIPVRLDEMGIIDLVVCGSVAVGRRGSRLGKGGGYSDLEFAIASQAGLISTRTVVCTTVHPVQIVDDSDIPMTGHDFPLDLIVTPDEVIRTRTVLPRPSGILDDHLDATKREAIPVLRG